MLQMLRAATAKITDLATPAPSAKRAPRRSPYQNYMCYQDGKPFMVVNAPSLEHAQFIVAGFDRGHVWMLAEMED